MRALADIRQSILGLVLFIPLVVCGCAESLYAQRF